MRVVLDTNVLVSAILFGGTPRTIVELAIRGDIGAVTSPHLLVELEEVLVEKFLFPKAAAGQIRNEVEWLGTVVEPDAVPRVLRDPDDDHVLAAAAAGGAEAIVTGDEDLLELGTYRSIDIETPSAFLASFQSSGG